MPRVTSSSLVAEDLIPDEPLQNRSGKRSIPPSDDLLKHGVLAAEVAQLALTSDGRLNIAVFGPWGSGKSSFFGLLAQEIKERDKSREILTFNAWENAGKEFHANFLSAIAGPDSQMDLKLYQSTRKVVLPGLESLRGWKLLGIGSLVFLLLLVFPPLVAAGVQWIFDPINTVFWNQVAVNIPAFFAIPTGGTILAAVLTVFLEMTKVTVEESAPSHVSEFKKLFAKQIGKKKHIIFIDELDRCGPEDVMLTLEGLRTFLDHSLCVFVVAFDRDAVSATIASHSRNARSERSPAYYQTSGEYIDKVFQFQVSLPPQQGHVTRTFAKSLVSERGGVWKSLREAGPDVLDRVVSILSPIHVTSPRRTKVLLNDFAVNARTYQDLGFDWIGRAEEIAVYSVIKTEFPYFAADLETEPMLLQYVAQDRKPTRPALKRLSSAYRDLMKDPDSGSDSVAIEDVVSTETDGEAVGSSERVNRTLAQQLGRYLEKLLDERYSLPRADVILMRNDPDLGGFEDGALQATLLLAGETGRQETVDLIRQATDADQIRAVEYLLRRIEQSPSSEWTVGLLNVALEIVQTTSSVPPIVAGRIRRRWESSSARADLESRLTPTALRGIARIVIEPFERNALESLIDRADLAGPEAATATLAELLDRLDSKNLEASSSRVLELLAQRSVDASVGSRALTRFSQETQSSFTEAQVNALARSYSYQESELEPSQGSARLTAAELQSQILADRSTQLDAAVTSFTDLVGGWDSLPTGGSIRSGILRALRLVNWDDEWAIALHDELLERDVVSGNQVGAGQGALEAIAHVPERAAESWLKFLPEVPLLDAEMAGSAMIATIQWALEPPDDDSSLDDAVAILRTVRGAVSAPSTYDDRLADVMHSIRPSDDRAFSNTSLRSRVDLLDSLDGFGGLDITERWADLVEWAVRSAATAAEVTQVVELVEESNDARLGELSKRLESARTKRDLSHLEIHALIKAQLRDVPRATPVNHLDWSEISEAVPLAGLQSVALDWLQTGPAVDELELASEYLELDDWSDATWKAWSEAVGPAERGRAWRFAKGLGLRDSALRIIAAAGVSDDLVLELAARVESGPSINQRVLALKDLRTLPMTAPLALAAIEAVVRLSEKARGVDGPVAYELVSNVASMLTAPQKMAAKKALGTWPNVKVSELVRVRLEDSGILNKRSVLGRVFRKN